MREKLIQIQLEEPSFAPGDIAEAILAVLRCDKCKHWGGPDKITGEGSCETVPSDDYIWTKPDFFCAYFKERAGRGEAA